MDKTYAYLSAQEIDANHLYEMMTDANQSAYLHYSKLARPKELALVKAWNLAQV
jgi:hypothetical protein